MEKRKSLLLFVLSLFISLGLYSCADKDKEFENEVIQFSQLPKTAQDFCNQYFSYTVVKGCGQINDNGELVYEVEFEDGSEVVFNSEGEWQEVSASDNKSIPDGITPNSIQSYLDEYYSDYGVNEINKTGYGYNVELTGENSIDLQFGPDGSYLGVTGDGTTY